MRILAMPAYFWPQLGGIETVTLALTLEWARLGHDVHVLTSRVPSWKKKEALGKIMIRRTGRHSVFGCPFSPAAFFHLLALRPDVAYLHYPHPFFLDIGVLGALAGKIPYVIHVHGPEITYAGCRGTAIGAYNRTNLHFALHHAAAIVSHTERAIAASPLLSRYKNKAVIIPHGTQLPPEGKKVMEQKNLVLFMGMLREYKRVDILIRAFVFVAKQIPTAKLVVVGEGPLRQEYELLAQELGLEKNVTFSGKVNEEQKWIYYKQASLFVLPSPTLLESFGAVALEAAVCKKPVIVAGAGIAEVFAKENIGVVVEPYNVQALANAIIDILLHPTKAHRIGQKSANVIMKKYTWDKQAKEYLAIFEKVQHGNRH